MLARLMDILRKVNELLEALMRGDAVSKNYLLYLSALNHVGKDASPNDLAPDEYACAETVNEIHRNTFGDYISSRNILSTYWMYLDLQSRPDFKQVSHPLAGDIIISPTGYGKGSGHVGIVGENGIVMSNNSFRDENGVKGVFDENYTVPSWNRKYAALGFPVVYFRKY